MKVLHSRGVARNSVGLAVALAMVIAAAITGLVQGPAQAYPTTLCTVSVEPSSLHVLSGQSITLTGSAEVTTKWSVNIKGITHYYTGTTFTASYRMPTVTHRTVVGVTVTCTNSTGSKTLRFQIIVDPFAIPATGSGGHLPGTGGPSVWWLVAAIAFLLAGTVLMASRRRTQGLPAGRHTAGR